jgi:hypothetical protein
VGTFFLVGKYLTTGFGVTICAFFLYHNRHILLHSGPQVNFGLKIIARTETTPFWKNYALWRKNSNCVKSWTTATYFEIFFSNCVKSSTWSTQFEKKWDCVEIRYSSTRIQIFVSKCTRNIGASTNVMGRKGCVICKILDILLVPKGNKCSYSSNSI